MKTKSNSTLSAAETKRSDQMPNRTHAIRGRWLAVGLGGVLFASLLALLPSSVQAQSVQLPCPEGWDISGNWGLKQSNQAEPNFITLNESSGISVGGPVREEGVGGSASYPGMQGRVIGKVVGFKVHLEISWKNGLTGIYDGKIRPGGKIEGTGYEKRSPSKKVTWYSDRAMICRPAYKPTKARAR